MLYHIQSVIDIVEWMDNKNRTLENGHNNKIPDYSQKEFFLDLQQITILIERSQITQWDPILISRCIKGLKGLTAKPRAVRGIIAALTRILNEVKGTFTGQELASLYGLQNMSAEYKEVYHILQTFILKINQLSSRLKPHEIALILSGIEHMSMIYQITRDFLKAIAPKINECTETFTSQDIGIIFPAVRNKKLSYVESRALLDALVIKIHQARSLDAHAIESVLSSFEYFKNEYPLEAKIFHLMAEKINESSAELSMQAFANALYGLRYLSFNFREVENLIIALEKKFVSKTFDVNLSLSWAQCCLAYLLLAQNSQKNILTLERVKKLFPDSSLDDKNDYFLADVIRMSAVHLMTVPFYAEKFDFDKITIILKNSSPPRKSSDLHPNEAAQEVFMQMLIDFLAQHLNAKQSTINPVFLIAKEMNNIQSKMRHDDRVVLPDLPKITGLINASQMSEWNPSLLSDCMENLKNISDKSMEVRLLLQAFIRILQSMSDKLSEENFASIMQGLNNMSADCLEIKFILRLLTPRMHELCDMFTPIQICIVFLGLNKKNASHSEVREMLSALTVKIRECDKVFSAKIIVMILQTLKDKSADYPEVRAALDALAPKIHLSEPFIALGIGGALLGLENMTGKYFEEIKILRALVEKTKQSADELNIQQFAQALYGLRHMNIDIPDVENLVIILENKYHADSYRPELSYSWTQCAIGYLLLAQNTQQHILTNERVKKLFPEMTIDKSFYTVEEVAVLFANRLMQIPIKNQMLDLNNIDNIMSNAHPPIQYIPEQYIQEAIYQKVKDFLLQHKMEKPVCTIRPQLHQWNVTAEAFVPNITTDITTVPQNKVV